MKYAVTLQADQREALLKLIASGTAPARKLSHARILLKADQSGPGLRDHAIAELLDLSRNTVFRVRKRFVESGLDAALNHLHPQNLKPHTLSPEAEAHLIALACTHEPGHARVALRLLADKMVELGHVEKISHETVRKTLKKTRFNPI